MAGVIIVDSIIRGRFQSASLSYAAFAPTAGRGYMSEGLGLVLRYAFGELRLHRLEANIQPGQPGPRSPWSGGKASARRATRAGHVSIDGAWRDHERWAITSEMTELPRADPHPTLPPRPQPT